MPRFYFDLVGPESVLDQHGMLLGDLRFAAHAAERLAAELFTVRPELRGTRPWCSRRAPKQPDLLHRHCAGPAPEGRDVFERLHPRLAKLIGAFQMTSAATAARSPPLRGGDALPSRGRLCRSTQ